MVILERQKMSQVLWELSGVWVSLANRIAHRELWTTVSQAIACSLEHP